ncbi:CrcB protein [Larkinella arboricola]|uniref:Fluoride-specific ion channel FluC n=1 Tax=Larkinella arboricola TaxID=643671 RepID=A0A327WXL0_LARAB|nr:fluoride efflux transporter CrcB [Larkinella arboricola]RAJ98082.1 CrcB protein [Larkinella arboricola]
MMTNPFWLVFFGGGLGSVARYSVSRYIQPLLKTTYPASTLIVNVVASLVLGFLVGWLSARANGREMYRLLIGVGFCGGFSTFSTFSTDTLLLMQTGRWLAAASNVALNVVLCLLASLAGLYLGRP